MTWRERLGSCESFDWDTANIGKLWRRHRVTQREFEEVFFDNEVLLTYDSGHSFDEDRYLGLGRTGSGRLLFFVFTVRGSQIRPISARDMTRNEQAAYARQKKEP
jgi:uncharacterized protein